MNIKTFIPTCIAAACVISCLTSCEEDLTPHGVAPSSIEDIRLNVMQDIRPGQPLTASITLPVGGENIAEVEYKWEASASSDSIVNGVAYYSFKAPKEAGNHSLSFKARYLFTGPDTEGNIYKDLTSELDYTVVPCDIFSSKWSDNTAKTKESRRTTRHLHRSVCRPVIPLFLCHHQPGFPIPERPVNKNHRI